MYVILCNVGPEFERRTRKAEPGRGACAPSTALPCKPRSGQPRPAGLHVLASGAALAAFTALTALAQGPRLWEQQQLLSGQRCHWLPGRIPWPLQLHLLSAPTGAYSLAYGTTIQQHDNSHVCSRLPGPKERKWSYGFLNRPREPTISQRPTPPSKSALATTIGKFATAATAGSKFSASATAGS